MSATASTAALGGGKRGLHVRGEDRERWLAHARAWHVRMKPVFDAMDARGCFADSPPPRPPFAPREGDHEQR